MPADIRHIVVLMMENRSFDHLLGYLDHPGQDYPRLKGTESNFDSAGGEHKVSNQADHTIVPGPGHHHSDVLQQLHGIRTPPPEAQPNNSGFVKNYAEICAKAKKEKEPVENSGPDVMLCLSPDKIPVVRALAREFAVCTRWFSSVPGMTWPNRNFVHAGTSDGEVDIDYRGYFNDTIFDRLSSVNVPWAIYCDGIPQTVAFPRLWDFPLDGRDNFRSMADFMEAAKKSRLPAYSFIEPIHFGPSADSMHPEYVGDRAARFIASENLIRRVYNALTSNPAVWKHTLLVITFDEHGGFYDREVPPPAIPPVSGMVGEQKFRFDRLGFRVPTILVSPWIKAGTLDHTVYDHTSVIATVREAFCPGARALTLRDAAAASVMPTLSLDAPRTEIPKLPVKYTDMPVIWSKAATQKLSQKPVHLDEFQHSLVELGKQVVEARTKRMVSPVRGLKAPPAPRVQAPKKIGEVDDFQAKVLALLRGVPPATPTVRTRGIRSVASEAAILAAPPTDVVLSAAEIRRLYDQHHAHLRLPDAVRKDLDALLIPPAATPRRARSAASQKASSPTLRVLTEGDSWFAFPPVTGRRGVVYHLEELRPKWAFTRLEKSGDELLGMLSGQQKANLRRCFREARFDLMLFSGGGNDIVGPDFASLLRPHQPGMIWIDCVIQDRLDRRLEQLRLAYLDLLALRNDYSPGTTLIANGYDYPIPQNRGVLWLGPWMHPYLVEKGIHSGPMQRDIARHMIKRFNETLASLTSHPDAAGKFHLAPTAGTLTPQDWGDEIHPTDAGFGLIADQFLLAARRAGY